MIYYIRHGETNDNLHNLLTGHRNVSLNEKGLKQAEEVAEELKNINFCICYCSPLIRTKQTLSKIQKYHPNLKIIYDKRIIERDYGEVSGLPTSICDFNRWDRNVKIPFKNFESVDDVFSRAKSFYDEIKQKHVNENVLIVSHSGFGRVSSCYFNGFPEDGDLSKIEIKNAKIVILQ